jgi:hypothetical protein
MRRKATVISKREARDLRKIAERTHREGGIPLRAVQAELLQDMAAELRRMASAYVRTRKGGAELLEALGVASAEGVDPAVVTEIIATIGGKSRRRRAA